MRRIQEEDIEEERSPLVSVDPAGEVGVRGEDGSKEAQEDEGGVVRRQVRSRRVRGESEALEPKRGVGRGKLLELHPAIRRRGDWGG